MIITLRNTVMILAVLLVVFTTGCRQKLTRKIAENKISLHEAIKHKNKTIQNSLKIGAEIGYWDVFFFTNMETNIS